MGIPTVDRVFTEVRKGPDKGFSRWISRRGWAPCMKTLKRTSGSRRSASGMLRSEPTPAARCRLRPPVCAGAGDGQGHSTHTAHTQPNITAAASTARTSTRSSIRSCQKLVKLVRAQGAQRARVRDDRSRRARVDIVHDRYISWPPRAGVCNPGHYNGSCATCAAALECAAYYHGVAAATGTPTIAPLSAVSGVDDQAFLVDKLEIADAIILR